MQYSCKVFVQVPAVTFLLISAIHSVSGLKCFVCDTDHHADCDDPFGNHQKYEMDCKEFENITGTTFKSPVCYKARDKAEYLGLSHEGTERGCAEYEGCTEYLQRAERYFFTNYLCQACIGDFCNGHIIYGRIN